MANERPARGAEAALKKLDQIQPVPEVVSQATIDEGKELLTLVAQGFGKRAIGTHQMGSVLTAMISGTSFADAEVMYIPERRIGDIYKTMSVVMGEYSSGTAYNVWFTRKDDSWVLKYNRIPEGGNLR